MDLQHVEQNDAATLNPIGRFDGLPKIKTKAGLAPSRPPISRAGVDKPLGTAALLSAKETIGIGTWNVRTLYQTGNFEILLNQIEKYKWEILGIAETHWIDSGEFISKGYKILCSGNDSIHRAGVAILLNKKAQNALLGYNPISARLLSARFQTQNGAMTVLQVYAPNTADSEEMVEEFYDLLQTTINKTPKNDILLVMGDLNAKVGCDCTQWENVIGNHGYGQRNDRGEKLLNFCAVNNLFITNTMFKQKKDSRQWTWESPDQKTHNKIDYIIISNRWKTSVTNARSFPSADVGSDHQLVITNIRLKFHAKKKPNYPKHYDIFRLKSPEHRKNYEVEIGVDLPHCWSNQTQILKLCGKESRQHSTKHPRKSLDTKKDTKKSHGLARKSSNWQMNEVEQSKKK
ncbi:craniofacial development protein 2-like [Amphiura filiformis]|uniref:craniofacial development protein 2-like n=1 Tax=Amphiura filiformis TaxID=82378 RepID=UPI003B2170F9